MLWHRFRCGTIKKHFIFSAVGIRTQAAWCSKPNILPTTPHPFPLRCGKLMGTCIVGIQPLSFNPCDNYKYDMIMQMWYVKDDGNYGTELLTVPFYSVTWWNHYRFFVRLKMNLLYLFFVLIKWIVKSCFTVAAFQ